MPRSPLDNRAAYWGLALLHPSKDGIQQWRVVARGRRGRPLFESEGRAAAVAFLEERLRHPLTRTGLLRLNDEDAL